MVKRIDIDATELAEKQLQDRGRRCRITGYSKNCRWGLVREDVLEPLMSVRLMLQEGSSNRLWCLKCTCYQGRVALQSSSLTPKSKKENRGFPLEWSVRLANWEFIYCTSEFWWWYPNLAKMLFWGWSSSYLDLMMKSSTFNSPNRRMPFLCEGHKGYLAIRRQSFS